MKTFAFCKKVKLTFFQKFILTFIGLIFGFCQNIAAQYGVVVDYLVRGKVISLQTSEPIPGLQIQTKYNDDKALSDSNGEFLISGRSMSNYTKLRIEDIDGDKNGSWLPMDTVCSNFDSSMTIYVKEEPKIEMFLKENPMFPTKFNGKKLKYTEFVYLLNENIIIEIKGNMESKVFSKIYLNGLLISQVTATDSKTFVETLLPARSNYIILHSECGNSDNQSSKKISINDGYNVKTVNLRSGKSESEAVILIYMK